MRSPSGSVEMRRVRWNAWEGVQYRLGSDKTYWVIYPWRPFVGGAETEQEVALYLDGMLDKQRGLKPEFSATDYMAGYRGDATYARGVIDAVIGNAPCSERPSYVAGYTYQPRAKRKPSGSGGRSGGGNYGGPRFY